MKYKVGDKVKLKDGDIATITHVDKSTFPYRLIDLNKMFIAWVQEDQIKCRLVRKKSKFKYKDFDDYKIRINANASKHEIENFLHRETSYRRVFESARELK